MLSFMNAHARYGGNPAHGFYPKNRPATNSSGACVAAGSRDRFVVTAFHAVFRPMAEENLGNRVTTNLAVLAAVVS